MPVILLIDDDAGVRRMMRRTLEGAGYSVVEAQDGRAGMQLYRSAPADLVITDVYMPGQDGIETIQQLRAEAPDSRILAISGGAAAGGDHALRDAHLLGADAVLAKPFGTALLLAAVSELLG